MEKEQEKQTKWKVRNLKLEFTEFTELEFTYVLYEFTGWQLEGIMKGCLGKLLCLFEPQSSHLNNGSNTYQAGLR